MRCCAAASASPARRVDIQEGSIFDKPPPSRAWHEALHGFAWLPPLATAGGEPARTLATNLIGQWVKRYPRYSEPEWAPHVMARRLIAPVRTWPLRHPQFRRAVALQAVRVAARAVAQLARIADKAPDGFAALRDGGRAGALGRLSRRQPASGCCRGWSGWKRKSSARSCPMAAMPTARPETLLHAYRHLVMVMDALTAIDHPLPGALLSAHDRMAPMLRFFRHGDGALALFNGGRECDRHTIAGLLARDEVRGAPFAHAPHSKFQRLAAVKTLCRHGLRPDPRRRFRQHGPCRLPVLRIQRGAAADRRQLRRLDASGMARCAPPRPIPP